MKKLISLLALGISLSCSSSKLLQNPRAHNPSVYVRPTQQVKPAQDRPSYKLEELCDTEIEEKELNLHVYIEPSEIIWDYHTYKDEIFSYVSSFFREQQIICNIHYSKTPLNRRFLKPNEVGIEIFESKRKMAKRYYDMNSKQKRNKIEGVAFLNFVKGYAETRDGIALIDGSWEEFRTFLTKEEVLEQFKIEHEGMTLKEHLFRINAGNICHEILHCLGLFHPGDFRPGLVKPHLKKGPNEIPNIMTFYSSVFTKEYPMGYFLSELQGKFIHSFIAGNNFYRAFSDSNMDTEHFIKNIARENNLGLR